MCVGSMAEIYQIGPFMGQKLQRPVTNANDNSDNVTNLLWDFTLSPSLLAIFRVCKKRAQKRDLLSWIPYGDQLKRMDQYV